MGLHVVLRRAVEEHRELTCQRCLRPGACARATPNLYYYVFQSVASVADCQIRRQCQSLAALSHSQRVAGVASREKKERAIDGVWEVLFVL